MANKNMKRVHSRIGKVAIKRIPDEISQSDENCIGIVAECEIWIPLAGQTWLRQNLSSGGLWGIDATPGFNPNATNKFLVEIEREQLDELRRVLHTLGFAQRAITAAFRNVARRGVE